MVEEGPWGGKGGRRWTYLPQAEICKISITYDRFIRTIQFTSRNRNGNLGFSNQFGRRLRGRFSDEINIDPNVEKLTGVSGTIGRFYNRRMITSLSFTTSNNNSYGPFGNARGAAFSYSRGDQMIIGFSGRSSFWIDAIGVYIRPMTYVNNDAYGEENEVPTVGPFYTAEKLVEEGPWGGNGGRRWTYVPLAGICNISITYDRFIRTIQFTSQDENGHLVLSDQFGRRRRGRFSNEINIDLNVEKLNGVSGTTGRFYNRRMITSLCFTTSSNNSYGPFGNTRGVPFSFSRDDQMIVGFYGRSSFWIDAIGVYLQPMTEENEEGEGEAEESEAQGPDVGPYYTAENLVEEGPWGGNGGRKWTYLPLAEICNISITYDRFIRTIQFTSRNRYGDLVISDQFGRKRTGRFSDEINIDPYEKLTGVSGTTGRFYNRRMITSLCFTTSNNNSYGPFGNARGSPFLFSRYDEMIVGFYGRSSFWIDAIGVYLQPMAYFRKEAMTDYRDGEEGEDTEGDLDSEEAEGPGEDSEEAEGSEEGPGEDSEVAEGSEEGSGEDSEEVEGSGEEIGEANFGPWGSQEEGNNWSYRPEGLISRISITHDDAIYSIQFTSEDDDGNVNQSEIFGYETGCYSDEIDIDIDNNWRLNKISGTVGEKDGYVVITSLSFGSDDGNTFGPFGTESGAAFSLSLDYGSIIGFYGRAGAWLDAIGVHAIYDQ